MDRAERFYKIDQLFQTRRVVPMELLMEELGVSRATVVRDLEYLRDRLNAPIVWDCAQRGYRYAPQSGDDPSYALRGLWFNASEAHALLTMEHLHSTLQPDPPDHQCEYVVPQQIEVDIGRCILYGWLSRLLPKGINLK